MLRDRDFKDRKMLRFEIIRPLINFFKDPKYLEIGVEGVITFHLVKAAKKGCSRPYFPFRFSISKDH